MLMCLCFVRASSNSAENTTGPVHFLTNFEHWYFSVLLTGGGRSSNTAFLTVGSLDDCVSVNGLVHSSALWESDPHPLPYIFCVGHDRTIYTLGWFQR